MSFDDGRRTGKAKINPVTPVVFGAAVPTAEAKAIVQKAYYEGKVRKAGPARVRNWLKDLAKVPQMTEIQRVELLSYPIPGKVLESCRQMTGASVEEFQTAMAMKPATWKRRTSSQARTAVLDLQEAESLLRIANITAVAERVIGKGAKEWLREAHPHLDGASPLTACRTEPGGRAVENMLFALEAGNLA